MSHRLVDVLILPRERDWVDDGKVDLVPEEIIEVHRRKLISATVEALLDSGFEGAIFLRFEVGVRQNSWPGNKGFFKARFFDSSRIGESQARAREETPALQDQQTQCHTGHGLVPERFIVCITNSCNG